MMRSPYQSPKKPPAQRFLRRRPTEKGDARRLRLILLGTGAVAAYLIYTFILSDTGIVRIAALKAAAAKLSLAGSAVASDAFFPFRDGLDALAEAGARAVIQPGGSVRDDEVIAAADEHGIAMVFTGVRHFRH